MRVSYTDPFVLARLPHLGEIKAVLATALLDACLEWEQSLSCCVLPVSSEVFTSLLS